MKEQIFGINAVKSRLQKGSIGVEKVLIRSGDISNRLQELLKIAQEAGCVIERLSDAALSQMTSVTHQGCGLMLVAPAALDESFLYDIVDKRSGDILLLVLDGVTDTRNLGACLRSAATMGVDAVVIPKDNSAPLNDAAVKTASGAASYVPLVQVTNLARCLGQLQQRGVWTVGTLLEAESSLGDIDLTGNIAVIMGSEEKGLRKKTINCCDYTATIPMVKETFGFNVSVATGICLYEVNRQRTK